MSTKPGTGAHPAIKDEEGEHPVADAWRPTIGRIVHAFVRLDYAIKDGIPSVDQVDVETAKQIKDYVDDYGEVLVELPEATWETSVASWQGNHWDVLVDLWTAGEGCSDMVLGASVFETGTGFRFEVHMVYVP